MTIRAILFDIYGTLIDIETDEKDWHTYLDLARYFAYRAIYLSADEVRWFYFEKIQKMITGSNEKYPEIDIKRIWYEILRENENSDLYRLNLDEGTFLRDVVVLHRSLTQRKLRLFPATYQMLQTLRVNYRLGIVSDCQQDYAIPEMKAFGIHRFFDSVIISADHGYRKPDPRLFNMGLNALNVSPQEAVFVGNDIFRDISGAKSVGMKTILVKNSQSSKDSNQVKPDIVANEIGDVPELIKRFAHY